MHFSQFFAVAATLAYAPAVYSYGVGQATLSYYEQCSIGEVPFNQEAKHDESVAVTADQCAKLKLQKRIRDEAYTVSGWLITGDTQKKCHAITVYEGEDCAGRPEYILPFDKGQEHAQGECLRLSPKFKEYVSFKLECAEEHGHKGVAHDGKSPLADGPLAGPKEKSGTGLPGLSALGL